MKNKITPVEVVSIRRLNREFQIVERAGKVFAHLPLQKTRTVENKFIRETYNGVLRVEKTEDGYTAEFSVATRQKREHWSKWKHLTDVRFTISEKRFLDLMKWVKGFFDLEKIGFGSSNVAKALDNLQKAFGNFRNTLKNTNFKPSYSGT